MALRIGETLAGRYELRAALGGGRGALFSAFDRRTGRDVAVKLFDASRVTPADLQRFAGRLAAAAATEHAAVVLPRVQVATSEAPPFVVGELLVGEDLASLCAREAPLPWARALAIARDCADGLAALASATGTVHGALHAGNVWISGERALVLDFGISELGTGASRVRADGSFAEHRAPEQLEGAGADGRSDVFALGVLLFTMVTGVHPFTGPTAAAVSIKVLMQPVPAVTSLVPQLPAPVAALIGRALARKPRDRFADVAALGRELVGLLPAVVAAPVVAAPVLPQGGRLVWESLPATDVANHGDVGAPDSSLADAAALPEMTLRAGREAPEDSLGDGTVLPDTTIREHRRVLERPVAETTMELAEPRRRREPTGERVQVQRREPTGERAVAPRREPTGARVAAQRREPTGERATARRREPTGERAVAPRREPTGARAAARREPTGARVAAAERTRTVVDERPVVRGESTLMLADEPTVSNAQGRVEATEFLQADELPTRTRMQQVEETEDSLRASGVLPPRVRNPSAPSPDASLVGPGRSLIRRRRISTLLIVNTILGLCVLAWLAWLLFGR